MIDAQAWMDGVIGMIWMIGWMARNTKVDCDRTRKRETRAKEDAIPNQTSSGHLRGCSVANMMVDV